ncbi:hypothetical protein CRM22_007251 [Opisthorchis felineus]|uniref:Uncharacterized protein n=1 Tax=Opisthorchis felineus TaxID=147828 RepID=A0A4S2LGT9_OPIFE|nr:hypothetical protein CRM22_007251 [Opisthorchis felineus]
MHKVLPVLFQCHPVLLTPLETDNTSDELISTAFLALTPGSRNDQTTVIAMVVFNASHSVVGHCFLLSSTEICQLTNGKMGQMVFQNVTFTSVYLSVSLDICPHG